MLVFRIGQLGDTIISLPAMWAIREHFKGAELTLLCDSHPGRKYVLAADLLRDTGIFDRFEQYPVHGSSAGWATRLMHTGRLIMQLRRLRYDTLVYLAPSIRSGKQIERDQKFFRLAGIRSFVGMQGFAELPKKIAGKPLDSMPSEADLLLSRLALDGIHVPDRGRGRLDLNLGAEDHRIVEEWHKSQHSDGGRHWIGVGPGSKMPAKRWPVGRYEEVVRRLIVEFDVWPVVFGGPEDTEIAKQLIASWGRGYNGCGPLSLRAAAAALGRCLVYIGNDTGTMHLAACAKTPCVAIFSARHPAGAWNPYGSGHRVFQSHIECEGCLLTECVERAGQCLSLVSTDEVVKESAAIISAATSNVPFSAHRN